MDVLPRMKNSNDPTELRRITKPLRRILRTLNVAALGTLHENKLDAQTFRQAMQGSVQYGALARSTFMVARHPRRLDARVAVLGPANYVPDDQACSLAFEIHSHEFDYNGRRFEVGRAMNVEPDETALADILASAESKRQQKTSDRSIAVLEALSGEPQSVRAIEKASGVPRSTVQEILPKLAEAGLAVQETGGLGQRADGDGAVTGCPGVRPGVRLSDPLRGRTTGHPPEGRRER